MEKHYTDMTFEELVDLHTRQIHSGLLEGGSKGMHCAVLQAMSQALQWGRTQKDLGEKEPKKPNCFSALPLSDMDIVQAGDLVVKRSGFTTQIEDGHFAIGQSVAAALKMRRLGGVLILRAQSTNA